MERFTFTVGKLDAGMAILIGERAHLIEFPSLLLPPGVTSGSIVNISVNRNLAAEKTQLKDFWSLQDSILQEYGLDSPSPPELRLRHVTQTSVTLEWPALSLAKADVRSLEIYKNGERLATIPNPRANTSTKLSSLQSNEEYTFQLVLKTTAGTYPSNIIRVRTHTMNDTSGISVCFGNVEDPTALSHAKQALDQMRAKWTDKIQIDTTHFVCSNAGPVGSNYGEGSMAPSPEFQKATQMSLPIVLPQWVLACHGERKLVPVSNYGLGSAPVHSNNAQPFVRRPSTSRRSSMTEAAEQLGNNRAPSPETIARMSMNPTSPTLEAPGGNWPRDAAQKPAQQPAAASSSSSSSAVANEPLAQEEQAITPPRTKSPRPEANGKLDRRFKFPNSPSPPVTGSSATFPAPEAEVAAPAGALQQEQKEEPAEPEISETSTSSKSAVPEPEVAPAEPIKIAEEPKSMTGTNEAAESPTASSSLPKKTTDETKSEDEDKVKAREWMERQNTVELDEAGNEKEKETMSVLAGLKEEDVTKPSEVDPPARAGSPIETPVPAPVTSSDPEEPEEEVSAPRPIDVRDVTSETAPNDSSTPAEGKADTPDQVVTPVQGTEGKTVPESEATPVKDKEEIVDVLEDLEEKDQKQDDDAAVAVEGQEDEEEVDTPSGAVTPAEPELDAGTGTGSGTGGGKSTGKKNKKKGKKGK